MTKSLFFVGGAATAIAIPVIITMMAIGQIGTAFSGWQLANAKIEAAKQHTEQVRIHETNETERTRIEWGARVDIASIEAHADIRTSWAGLGHRMLTIVAMIGSLVIIWIVALWLWNSQEAR